MATLTVRPVYTITYDANGGILGSTGTATAKVQVEKGSYRVGYGITDRQPYREGYAFVGWMYNNKYPSKVTVKSNITLTAVWEEAEFHTLTFELGGGHFPGMEGNLEIPMEVNTTFNFNTFMTPVRDGYVFMGWTVNGRNVTSKMIAGDTTAVAKWEEGIAVTYDANGGKFPVLTNGVVTDSESSHVSYALAGSYAVGYMVPDREGWDFDGWSVDGKRVTTVDLTGPITVKAEWSRWVNVTFDANGGGWGWNGESYAETAQSGEYRTGQVRMGWMYPDQREGYTMVGWSDDPNAAEGQPEFDYDVVEEVTFYAVWVKNPTVTYDANGGGFTWDEESGSFVDPVHSGSYDIGEYYIDGWEPGRNGYRFLGWTADESRKDDETEEVLAGGTRYDLSKEDVTFYAVWEKLTVVTYDANGGYWGEGETQQSVSEQKGRVYYVRWGMPTREGYEFQGWVDENGNAAPIKITLGEDVTYYASWAKYITITYDANGGGWGWDGEKYAETQQHQGWTAGMVHIGNEWPDGRDGYEFLGWSQDPNATEATADFNTTLEDDTTYYAIWERLVVVTYDANGGSWGDETTRIHQDRRGYTYYVGMDIPWREGFEFRGWAVTPDASLANAPENIELGEDVTYYAVWAELVTVTYVGNGGGWGWNGQRFENGIIMTQTAFTGEFTVDSWGPYQEGFAFAGWTADASQRYSANAPLVDSTVILTEDITLYAVWQRMPRVIYDPNGGTWGNGSTATRLDYVRNLNSYTVGGYYLQRMGYTFLGWSTDPEATAAQTSFVTAVTEDTTFYAIWNKQVAITFNAPGGSIWNGGETYTVYVTSGQAVNLTELVSPYREGYLVKGWALEGDKNQDPVDAYLQATEDMTLEVIWEEAVTLTLDANGGTFTYLQTGESGERVITTREGYVIYLSDFQDPVMPGKVFDGWTLNGKLVNRVKMSDDVTLVAQWSDPEELYTLTFDATIAKFESTGSSVLTVDAGGDFDLSTVETPVLEGYYFDCWSDGEQAYRESQNNTVITVEDDMTFYAAFNEGSRVRFDANGGYFAWPSSPEQVTTTVTAGESFYTGMYGEPVRDGYRFLGWSLDGESVEGYLDITKNITLLAQWKESGTAPTSVTITADRDDLTDLVLSDENGNSVSVTLTASVAGLTEEELENADYVWYESYEGNYWYEASKGTDILNNNAYVYTANYAKARQVKLQVNGVYSNSLELVARYESEAQRVPIRYHGNGGWFSGSDGDSDVYVEYRYLGEETTVMGWGPYRDDGFFLGWKDNPEGDGLFITEFTVEETNDFYAVWGSEEGRRLTVTLDGNGGVFNPEYSNSLTSVLTMREGERFYSENYRPVKGGYALTGWLLNGEPIGDSIIVTEDIILVAQWERGITVSYDANGGSFYDGSTWKTVDAAYGTSYYVGGDVDTPERDDGYWFNGWLLNGENVGWEYITVTEDIVLTANWARNVTVSLDANGGVFEQNDASWYFYTVNEGQEYWYNWFIPTRDDGYAFKGWLLNGEPVGADSDYFIITEDVTLVAEWTAGATVTRDADGGTFASYGYGETFSYTVAIGSTEGCGWYPPEREGYVVDYWLVNEERKEDYEQFEVTRDTTVKVVWIKAYTVTLDANEGYFSGFDGAAMHQETVKENGEYWYGQYVPTRDGYTFAGWTRSGETDVLYDSYFTVTEDVTLVARWDEAEAEPETEEEAAEPEQVIEEPEYVEPDPVEEEPEYVEPEQAIEEPEYVEPEQAIEEPVYAEPEQVIEEPEYVEPEQVVEEPEYVEPEQVIEEPAYVEPEQVIEESTYEEPVVEEPVYEEPVTEEPVETDNAAEDVPAE